MDNRPIGIFDSGVGGLTVLSEIRKNFPNENLIYLGDTLNFPYGDKSKDKIIKYSIENAKFLISKDIKLLVIACGTATSYSLDILKEMFDIPITGIIEPTVSYIKEKGIKEVGVAATVGTINSGSWERNLKRSIPGIKVINKACPMLATVAEEGKARGKEGRCAIKEYMSIFKENKVDNIILGCTHYPIYDSVIRDELGYNVNLINTGVTVANFIKRFLIDERQGRNNESYEKIYLSKASRKFVDIANELLNESIEVIQK